MAQWIPIGVSGDYGDRQAKANKLGAVCYYEQHMNSYTTAAEQYGLVEVASNASAKSKAWAAELAARCQAVTFLPTRVRQIPYQGRGDYNIRLTAMPACLGEPGPINHVAFDKWMEVAGNRALLAAAVAESIFAAFPDGGIVALSVGHLGKTSSPHDTGAGDSDPDNEPDSQTEGWYNADIIERVAIYLAAGSIAGAPQPPAAPIPAPTPKPPTAPVPAYYGWPGRNFQARMDKRGRYIALKRYGEDFKPWQRQMAARGWNIGAADGVFGPKCYAVCRAFQAEKGLTVDGIVGRHTWVAAWTAPVT
jgi:hypothetical protein